MSAQVDTDGPSPGTTLGGPLRCPLSSLLALASWDEETPLMLLLVISSGSSCRSLLGRVPSEDQGYWVFSLMTCSGRNRPGWGRDRRGLKAAIPLPQPIGGPQNGWLPGPPHLGVSWANSIRAPCGEGWAPATKITVPSLEAIRDLLSWEGGVQAPWVPFGQVARVRRVLA